MKAQKVKNAVIVPSGAKGGFVVKQPPADPAQLRDEVEACYRLFIAGAARRHRQPRRPATARRSCRPTQVVRYDGDDPYLVVAADKGTAAFSDVANEIALRARLLARRRVRVGRSRTATTTRRWASPPAARGSRCAATSATSTIDPDRDDFTVVGHRRHVGRRVRQRRCCSRTTSSSSPRSTTGTCSSIPIPTPTTSFAGAQAAVRAAPLVVGRLRHRADLRRAAACTPRTLKSIPITARGARPARHRRRRRRRCTPAELIRADPARAGRPALQRRHRHLREGAHRDATPTSATRPTTRCASTARELRCRARRRGRQPRVHPGRPGRVRARTAACINTDAIDNSAGVDTSDHEVNIKILLDGAVRDGELSDDRPQRAAREHDRRGRGARAARQLPPEPRARQRARRRRPRWKTCTRGSCARSSSRSISTATSSACPTTSSSPNRRNAGLGLTVPELAVLLAYAKITLEEELLACPLPDDPDFIARARALLPHRRARALPRPHPRAPAAPRDHRDRARERPREPGRHHVRVPDRRGDRRARARHRARPRSGARDLRPGRAVARHRGARRARRRRRADRDVPRVAQARGAGEPLAAPPPQAPARRSRRRSRSSRRRSRGSPTIAAGVRARQRAGAARARDRRAHGARRAARPRGARSPRSTSCPAALDIAELADAHGASVERVARGLRGGRRPAPPRLAPRPHRRAAPRRPLGRARPQRAPRRRRGRAPRRRRRGAARRRRRQPTPRPRSTRGPPVSRPRSTARSRCSTTSRRRASSTSPRSRSPSASSAP